ncbi:DUF1036 domain-containing protein [Mesorhizobium sp. BAC0120]|uniref:DUF1036 domain-containing protein n=1 Tax=Mesorhizobium sp. BAC0120 TaxID=3090670 RepID=UPI00298D1A9B|nr:DUF1036 domain-containing protein [Mesorhizobium sp. BAC0120]MDW6026567.1 DUF1036 domain-containing protein [Mesorhizobium sp. BAC0120]
MVGQAIRIFLRDRSSRGLCAVFGVMILTLASVLPARAQFAVCNQTLDAVNLAIAKAAPNGTIVSEGWWTIGANRCVDVIKEELANKYIYVYASDVFGQPILAEGFRTFDMCVAPKRFTIEGTDSCWQRGFEKVRFMEVDTKDQVRWTLYLREPYAG